MLKNFYASVKESCWKKDSPLRATGVCNINTNEWILVKQVVNIYFLYDIVSHFEKQNHLIVTAIC